MQTQPTSTTDGASPERAAAALAAPLAELIETYEGFIKTLEDHRAAISRADGRAIAGLVESERASLATIARLDAACRAALGHPPVDGRGAAGPRGAAGGGLTITRVAEAVGGETGASLAESAAYLRALASRADVLQKSVGEASRSLSAHLSGLMRQVAQRLSHTGTYGAAGRVDAGTPVVSGLDVSL